MLNTFSSFLIEAYFAYSLENESVDKSSSLINEIAKTIWSALSIAYVVVFCLALFYKPLHKLHLIIIQLLSISYILSENDESSTIRENRLIPIIFAPLFMCSTLAFTSIVTILSNIGILVSLIAVNKLDDNKAMVIAMVIQPLLLFKFDVIVTQFFWKEVCLDQGY